MLGSQASYVAIPFQLKQLTHSTAAVGAIGLVELAPLVFFGLYGGVLADRLNRRRVMFSMELVMMISTAVLVGQRVYSAIPWCGFSTWTPPLSRPRPVCRVRASRRSSKDSFRMSCNVPRRHSRI